MVEQTISFLSAVYNEGEFVDEMIDSLQQQNYPHWEVVFVDDDSTDDTVAKIQARMKEEPRIKLLSGMGKLGKVRAFNLAFENAEGDLIALLAGDDCATVPDSVGLRVRTHKGLAPETRAISFYKLRMFSDDPTVDGMIVPKGDATNQSGACMVLSRSLAEQVFPIAEHLISEDIWIRYAARSLAQVRRDVPEVIMEYRQHANNSNPRRRPFPEMSAGMHARFLGYRAVLNQRRFSVSDDVRGELEGLALLEELRNRGLWCRILFAPGTRIVDRLAMVSMAHPTFYWFRNRFYAALSGLRGG